MTTCENIDELIFAGTRVKASREFEGVDFFLRGSIINVPIDTACFRRIQMDRRIGLMGQIGRNRACPVATRARISDTRLIWQLTRPD